MLLENTVRLPEPTATGNAVPSIGTWATLLPVARSTKLIDPLSPPTTRYEPAGSEAAAAEGPNARPVDTTNRPARARTSSLGNERRRGRTGRRDIGGRV